MLHHYAGFGGHPVRQPGVECRLCLETQPEDLGELAVDLLHMNPRILPSNIELRPSRTANKA